jgi:3-hydroxybutyryl-CoA dehydrogenase
MTVNKVGVIGAGTMGNGIAHVFAQHGFDVVLVDINHEYLNRAIETIARNMDRQIKKTLLSDEQKKQSLGRITTSTSLEMGTKESDIVVEAATENLKVKRDIFRTLDKSCKPEAILATNTSSISITELASITSRPGKVIGMHFFNPVPVMRLIEIVRGYLTSDDTNATAKDLSDKLEKYPVEVKDYPGFISNRILMPMINEAVYCLMEGVGTVEAIDNVMKLGMNHPMGPLTLADFIGLDVCLSIMEVMHEGLGDPKYRPCPLLKKMVAAGYVGKKVGKGFYEYPERVPR